jgi:hypothetical protein
MSGITTGTALAIGLGASAAGAGISAIGATSAANTQAGAAQTAAQLQAQEAQNALNFQQQEWAQNQANEKPFLQAGQGAVSSLSNLMQNNAFPAWNQQFQPPTAQQAEATPGYQFQLQQGEQAIQRSAAAQGGLLSGGTAKALNNYAQGVASGNYQQVYNNAFQQYQQQYGQFQQNQANQYNRLANLAGFGQVSAGSLGAQGQQAAQNTGNIFLTAGQQQAQDIQNAAAATASGYAGLSNAASGGLGQVGNYALLNSLLNGSGGGSAFDANLGFQPAPNPIAVPGNGSGLLGVAP